MPEGLFDDDPRTFGAIRFRKLFHNGFKQNGRDCQVMCRTMRVLELFAERRESRRVLVLTVNVAQQGGQLFENRGIDPAGYLQAVVRARTKLIEIPSCFGDTDHRYIKTS